MAKHKRNVLYMAVELDEYEYCCAFFDDIKSLAAWAGLPVNIIRYYLRYNFIDFKNKGRYIKVIF